MTWLWVLGVIALLALILCGLFFVVLYKFLWYAAKVRVRHENALSESDREGS